MAGAIKAPDQLERHLGSMQRSSLHLDRRRFLGATSMAVVSICVTSGCRYYRPEAGAAYEPWNFPDADLSPRLRLVHAATLAASPHNTQPWWFQVGDDTIELWADAQRDLGAMDPLGREMRIGLGCALENLRIAAKREGFAPELELVPDPSTPELVARVRLPTAEPEEDPLYEAIATRHTNRGAYADVDVPASLAGDLERTIADIPEVRLVLLTGSSERASFRDGTIDATRAIVADDEMHEESLLWYRHGEDEIAEHRDGLTLDGTGAGAGIRFFGKSGRRPSSERSGKFWIRATKGRQTTGSGFGVLATAQLEDLATLLRTGMAWQRLHLWMESQGLAAQPLNQMAERRDRELELGLEPVYGRRLATFTGPDRHGQLLFRLGYAWDDAIASPRRPVDWVTERSDR